MNKFDDKRIKHCDLVSNEFKFPIPIVFVTPLSANKNTCVFIFCCGLGGTNSFNVYMNNPIYDNNYFVMYDKMGHGDNKNKPSQYKNKYIIELDKVVNWAKRKFPKKRIYLLGESWGAAINFLYYKKFAKKINGVINWNMPTRPISPIKKTALQKWQNAWREIITILTNRDLKLPFDQTQHEHLSRNKMLIRAMALQPAIRNSTKLTLAVWRCMYPSYKFLLKNISNPNCNFLYVQSFQDALMFKKHIENVEKKADSKHYLKIPTGYHILTMEPEESKTLYKAIEGFIKK